MDILHFALLPGLISAAVTFIFAFLVIRFARKLKIVDDPRGKKHPKIIHTYPTPRGGGIAIFAGVLATSLFFLPLDKHLQGILAGALVLTIVGFLDDRHDLNPYLRLALGGFAAILPIAAGIGISFISNPFGGGTIDLSLPRISFDFLGEMRSIWILSDAFALVWLVFMMNMLNMGAKGVDGQLPGVVVIAAGVIAALSLKFSADVTQWPVIVLAGAVAGAYLGFLPWNFYPQKIMPGYGGAILAGYFLAILSILATTKVGALIVVLAVPLIDTGYTVARRIIAGKSPVWGDTGHLHHRLLRLGWGRRRVAVFYWGITLALGLLSLNLNTAFKFYTMVGVSLALGGLIIWLTRKR